MTQIKSKARVRDLAEVYTAKREVNAMLDLLKDESYRIDSKFLEPACGNGNFLEEIVRRKLKTVVDISKNDDELFLFTIKAITSVYGVDICNENCEESRKRIVSVVSDCVNIPEKINNAIKNIVEQNIVVGDTINKPEKIIFTEYIFDGDMVTCKYWNFGDIVNQTSLFDLEPFLVETPTHYSKL